MIPLLGLVEILAISGGGVLAAIFAFLKIKSDGNAKKAADAKAREEAVTGELKRDEELRLARDVIKEKADAERRARAATDAKLEADKATAAALGDAERRRTEAAVAKGPEALTDRANEALRDGRVPKGRTQP